jgi:hypothetical protein
MTITPIPLLRGTLITFRRKCGKAGCHCAGKKGTPHESPALKCTIGGRSQIVTLTAAEVPLVREALDRYHSEQQQLEDACTAGMVGLRDRIAIRRSKGAS